MSPTKLNASYGQLKLKLVNGGMLRDQDMNGIRLEILPKYQFEPYCKITNFLR